MKSLQASRAFLVFSFLSSIDILSTRFMCSMKRSAFLPYSICVSQIGLAIIIPPILLIFVFLLPSYDFLLRRQCFLDKYLHDMM